MNVTFLGNCEETGESVPMHLNEVWYEMDPVTNYCMAVHGKFTVESVDATAKDLNITFYRCAGGEGSCLENPVMHYEELHCERFMTDDTGPWYMFREAMTGGHCGAEAGKFELEFATLRMKHITKYLDLETEYNRFRITFFYYNGDTDPITVRACGHMDFTYI